MSARVRAVTFANQDGHRLFGILHEPETPCRDVAVVLLPAGVKARVGPHGLYVQITRMLVQRGFRVLRFDFWGIGDSEGTATEGLLADLYGSVAVGRHVEDTHAAVRWMCETVGAPRILLAGLCGGAITGLMAGATDLRVAGLLGLGLPLSVDGSNVDKVRYMSVGQLEGIRSKYVRKLLDPQSWSRLLSFKTDYRLLLRSLWAPLKRRFAAQSSKPSAAGDPEAPPNDNTNPYFRPSLMRMIGNRQPVMLLFSESDRLYAEFRERFVDRYHFDVTAHPGVLDVAVVKDANHVFTFKEWQLDMLDKSAAWLDARFPPRSNGALPTQGRQ